MQGLSRRFVLGGGIAAGLTGLAGGALAEAPTRSVRPVPRYVSGATRMSTVSGPTATAAETLIAEARLGGKVSYVVADARTGLILESRGAAEPMPPASTTKAITSLYALEHLGNSWRFATQIVATGPVRSGVVQGDLVLAGGGDPELSTDDLGDLALRLKQAGITGLTGRFRVWAGALPYLRAIDSGQPAHVGYSPAVCGLNLNFNRVHFEWKRGGSDYEVAMDARGARFRPAVRGARISVADRARPVYTYAERDQVEHWTVARGALGKGGSRWLPVRQPALYAGEVFQTLARAQGIALPAPVETTVRPSGSVLAEVQGKDLRAVLRDMMRFSTNLTAEVVGMTASRRLGAGESHVASGQAMSRWLEARAGVSSARFTDHSGLGGASRIAAADMVRALVKLGPAAGLGGLMRDVAVMDAKGQPVSGPIKVVAKTGTLNFVSALAGYATAGSGSDLAFAIFTADVARRDAIPEAQMERPEGGSAWIARSRRLQQALLERWGIVYRA